MTRKKTTGKPPRPARTKGSEAKENQINGNQLEANNNTRPGAPVEHYHVEPTGKTTGDPGSLDEETLDRDAPYNKTYGRQ